MPRSGCPRRCFILYFLYLLSFLYFPPARAQQPPADAAEISRELLYHPARLIEFSAAGPNLQTALFRAKQFLYRFDAAAGKWEVQREKNDAAAEADAPRKRYQTRQGMEYRFAAASTEEEGILEIRRSDQTERVARIALWNRAQLATTWLALMRKDAPRLTAEALARDLEIADPQVAGVADDGTHLWLAIEQSAGEGELGIGSVVRFDPQTDEAKVYQPPELATSSVTHIAPTSRGALWLGAHRRHEGASEPTAGLVRFDSATGEIRSYLPGGSPLVGRIVTALAGHGSFLLVGTDEGMCRLTLAGAAAGLAAQPAESPGPRNDWTCWRIVPTVRLATPAPVSNRPGAPPRGRLAADSYEVRWANAAFLEVVTPDAIEGWVAADDLEDYTRRRFESDTYELGNPSAGGAAAMRLLDKPGGDPLAAAQVYRAPLERVGSLTPPAAKPAPSAVEGGWQRVRARVGWISRGNLEVTPVIEPASH